MPWDERQQALLRGMGLRVWAPPGSAEVTPSVPDAPPVATTAADADAPVPLTPRARVQEADARPAPAPASMSTRSAPTPSPVHDAGGPMPDARGLDWPALREAVADCRACSLCETRRQTVFGVGSPRAHWMVVGEAPGENEDRQGEPFVGNSGQLLDRMLAALGLSRDPDGDDPARQVYIANTLKCRPPMNRNPAPDEMARCEPFLVRQIELLQPRIILAMGRFAVQALLRTQEPIGKLRGRVHTYQGVPLVVTYHPSYLLRSLPDKARAWEDLCLAAETVERASRPAH